VTQEAEKTTFEFPDPAIPIFDDVGEAAFTASSPREPQPRRCEFHTLEDIYAAFPEMGLGEWKMRVTRTWPKSHNGYSTAGFLEETYQKLSLAEFKNRFGGGQYTVLVMRPTSADGQSLSDFKTVKEVKFRISGEPVVDGVSVSEDKNVQQFQQQSSALEIERLRDQKEERQRLNNERLRLEDKLERERAEAQKIPEKQVDHIYETSKRAYEDSRQATAAQMSFWEAQCNNLRAELDTKSAELRRREQELYEFKHKAETMDRAIESRVLNEQRVHYESRIDELKDGVASQMKEVRDRYEDDRRRTQEESSRKVEQLNEDYRKQIADLTLRNSEAYRALESSQALERERVRDQAKERTEGVERSAKERVDNVERSKAHELAQMKETYDQRFEDLRLSFDRQAQSMRDAHVSQLESIRTSERSTAEFAKQTAEQKKDHFVAERDRLREEMNHLKRENAELQAKLHKDPAQYLTEVKAFAGDMLGMVDASEIPQEKGDGDSTPMDKVFKLAEKAFEKAPDVLEKIMERRQQGGAGQQAMAMQQQQQQMAYQQQLAMQQQAYMQQQPRSLPQRQQQQAPQPRQAPNYAPPPFGGATYAPPTSGTPFAPGAVMGFSPVQPSEPAGPTSFTGPPASAESETAVVGAPMQAPPPAAATLTAEQQDATKTFFKELETAVSEGVVSPELFAKGFVSQLGPERSTELLQRYRPSDIVETAQQLSADSAIATRRGRQYVAQLWQDVAKVLQGGAAA